MPLKHDEPSADPLPEREVFYKNSKNAARNKRRRKRRKIERDQQKKPVTARIDETHVKMRLYNRQKSRTPSDEDARAKSRSVSPKTAEEADDQGAQK